MSSPDSLQFQKLLDTKSNDFVSEELNKSFGKLMSFAKNYGSFVSVANNSNISANNNNNNNHSPQNENSTTKDNHNPAIVEEAKVEERKFPVREGKKKNYF